ncbi:acyltransferase family protein [Novosphingobium pokkalii]|uniref:acyltransferase family protein n=1 Tax=Novosphingobium pokkalii TaxID=1770194 RepID=UPI003640343A
MTQATLQCNIGKAGRTVSDAGHIYRESREKRRPLFGTGRLAWHCRAFCCHFPLPGGEPPLFRAVHSAGLPARRFLFRPFRLCHRPCLLQPTARQRRVRHVRDPALWSIWPMHMVVLAAFIVAETAIFIAQSHIGGALPRPPFSADRTLAAIPANLLLLNGTGIYEHSTWNGPSWSVSAELWINVLFGLCAITAGRRHMALAMAMLAAGSAIILILFCPTYLDTDGAYALFRCGYGFFIGYFVWRAVQARKGSTPRPVLDSLIEIALVISAVTFISYAQVGPWQMPIPLFFAIFVYLFARQAGLVSRLLESRPIQKLGHLSYAIYIIHFFFAFALNNVIRVGGKIAHVPSVLPGTQLALVGNAYVMDGITIAYLAIVITTAHFANRWIETPAMLWFNRQSVWLAEKRQGLPPASAS